MDSVSHIIIGAAIGEVTLGKKIGRWGMLLGAFAKTFPDFDLFYTGLKDAKMYMCYHRGHTHSLIWEFLYAIPLAYVCHIIFKNKVSFKQMFIFWIICLWGHSLLDVCTNYGTRLLLPFTNENYALNSISIVDLIFTAPMLIASLISIFLSNRNYKRLNWNKFILIYCCMYLSLTLVNKLWMNHVFEKSLTEQNIPHDKYMTNPSILNNILWYANASNDSLVYCGEYSWFDKDQNIKWTPYKRNMQLAAAFPDTADVKSLNWFSKGYSICEQKGDTLHYYAIKFGRNTFKETETQKSFVFHYELYKDGNQWKFGMTEPPRDSKNFKKSFSELWNRLLGIKK